MFNETKQRNLPEELPEPTQLGLFLHMGFFLSALFSLASHFDHFWDWLDFIRDPVVVYGALATLPTLFVVASFYEERPIERGQVAGLLLVVGLPLSYFGCFKTALLLLVRVFCLMASPFLLIFGFYCQLIVVGRVVQTWRDLSLNKRLAFCMVTALTLIYYGHWGIIAYFVLRAIAIFCILLCLKFYESLTDD
jgi:hypothetical protein